MKWDYKYLISFSLKPATMITKGRDKNLIFPPKIERETPKLAMFIQDLDQLVRKVSLGKEISKKKSE